MTPTVRFATHDDVSDLSLALARAFSDDPIWLWLYPQGDRTRRLRPMFDALLRTGIDRGATVLTDDERRGAAIWQRSTERSLGARGKLRMASAMARGGADIRRGMQMLGAVEKRHPKAPHLYLALLGTDPAAQGTGVGSALVREVLDAPDNAVEAAYLETETEANVAFYWRFGFEVVDEVDVGSDGPHLWFLWRDPTG